MLGILGRGGFGVVYHARSRDKGREFALKTWIASSLDRRAIARFRQESEIWIALGNHPYVVQALFADDIDGRLYVGLELIRPGLSGHADLEGVLSDGLPAMHDVLRWMSQLCYGMEYAALRGIRAHRDLKPANVMLNDASDVKINDFGLATQPATYLGDADPDPGHWFKGQTLHGIGFGTPTHMPPEQFEDATLCDARSDIYSTGVMLHQLVHGSLPVALPWPEDTSLESRMRFWAAMKDAHLAYQYEPRGHVLDTVISRCLATRPDDRYPDFSALRSDIESIMASRGQSLVPAPMVRSLSARSWVARGRSLGRIGRHPQALHAFEQALLQEPENESGRIGKADALLDLDKPHLAQPLFDAILQSQPTQTVALMGKARCLHARGYPREALTLMDRIPVSEQSKPDPLVHRSRLQRSLGYPDEAMESLSRALEKAPGHVEALTEKARILAAEGSYSDALFLFERALGIHPLHDPAARGQAACLVALGRFQEAIPLFQSLDRSASLHDRGRLLWAEALSRHGRPEDAEALLSRITDSSLLADRDRMQPQILVDQSRLDDALAAWMEASFPAGAQGDFQAQGDVLHVLTGLESKALQRVSDALAAEPGHEAICVMASGAALRAGQDAQALQACSYGLAFHAASPLLRYNNAVALVALNRGDEAIPLFDSLAVETSAPALVREWSRFNAAVLSGSAADLAATDRAPHAASSNGQTILSDEWRPLRPLSTLRITRNGWNPRYRLTHVRPALYLFPRLLPHPIAD